ncbi:type I-E CRISPR-associated protein Cse1/CasA [Streptomyces sp. NPDC059142]|uniref:type I-E CRISPR-associated protein Cse1/CasA n=1 Tax=Streptomyces sp. NPDC059142 TaxID=3346739 RepID=UPI00369B47C8
MTEQHPTYPLTTSPWIPVLDLDLSADASHRAVGITEALTRAHRLRLAAGHTSDIPVLRLLAAVLDAACGPATTAEWDAAWRAEALPADRITAYTKTWAHRLDLLDPQRPAFQCGALTAWNRDARVLDPSALGGGAGKWFSSELRAADTEGYRAWEPGEAAVRLLWLLAYDVAGIKGAAPGDPAAKKSKIYGSQVGAVAGITHLHLSGATLKDDLLLALPPQPRAVGDAPVWERSDPPTAMRTRAARGRLDRLTWPSRRIRLHADADGRVDLLAVHDGDRLDGGLAAAEPLDPMSLWRTTKKGNPYPMEITAEGWPVPWQAARALDPGNQGRSAVIDHAIAAAERGAIPPDYPLRVTTGQIIHANEHRATISDDPLITVLLGTGATLADPPTRQGQARRARYAEAKKSDLFQAVREVVEHTADRYRPRLLFTELSSGREWEQAVRLDATDPDAARSLWGRAVKDAAAELIARLPMPMKRQTQVQAAYDSLARMPRDAEPTQKAGKAGGRPATRYEWRGQQYTLKALSELPECTVSYATLHSRVKRGVSVEEAMTTAAQRGPAPATPGTGAQKAEKNSGRPATRYEWRGQQYTVTELAAHPECGVSAQTLRRRLRAGMSVEDAVTARTLRP